MSAFGLREGLLLEMAGAKEPTGRPIRCGCSASSPSAASRDRRHVEQVRYLALQLFDQLGAELGCEPEERLLLEAAGAAARRRPARELPEAPQAQLPAHHARRAAGALPPRERGLVALISRYHRRTGPRKKHPEFAALPPRTRRWSAG